MANDVKVLSFKVDSFRKIPNPYLKSDNPSERNPQMYMMVCDVMDLPDDFPMDTNPRKQSLKTEVAKEISNSLISPSDQRNFYLLNRGLLLQRRLYPSIVRKALWLLLFLIFPNMEMSMVAIHMKSSKEISRRKFLIVCQS